MSQNDTHTSPDYMLSANENGKRSGGTGEVAINKYDATYRWDLDGT